MRNTPSQDAVETRLILKAQTCKNKSNVCTEEARFVISSNKMMQQSKIYHNSDMTDIARGVFTIVLKGGYGKCLVLR